jgi:hypothetical protein
MKTQKNETKTKEAKVQNNLFVCEVLDKKGNAKITLDIAKLSVIRDGYTSLFSKKDYCDIFPIGRKPVTLNGSIYVIGNKKGEKTNNNTENFRAKIEAGKITIRTNLGQVLNGSVFQTAPNTQIAKNGQLIRFNCRLFEKAFKYNRTEKGILFQKNRREEWKNETALTESKKNNAETLKALNKLVTVVNRGHKTIKAKPKTKMTLYEELGIPRLY